MTFGSRAPSNKTPTPCCSCSVRVCTWDDPELEGWAEIIIGKQRNGPVGIHKLAFAKEYVRFDVLAGVGDEYDQLDDFINV